MKKRLLKTITVLFLLCGFFMPLKVHAKELNGYSFSDGTVIEMVLPSITFNLRSSKIIVTNGSGVYYTYTLNNKNSAGYVFYSQNVFEYDKVDYDVDGNVISNNHYVAGLNSSIGLYRSWGNLSYNSSSDHDAYTNPASLGDFTDNNDALSHFNDLVVNDLDFSYGRPANVQYSTRIAGSGAAAANNIDRITWNTEVDHNGTVLPQNARVQIRAIPGQYTGTSKQDLLTKTYTDFLIDNTKAVQLVDLIASRGVYEIKWSEVIEHFNLPFATFNSLIEGDSYWYRNGWIYQIRLQVDDYYSSWTNIYTATGSGVKESDAITSSDTMTQELIQQIQIINTLNETNTNWYISDTEINMQPYEEPAEGDKPWWAYLLEAIVQAFGDILAFLGNLIGDLMDAITDLFKPAEFTINEYNDFKVEIKQNSGLFGQAIDFTNDLKNTFMGVQYQEPILHWQGISFDGIVFIPAADYNLNEYVEMWGLGNFRQIAYICSDGFIFFSLLLLIVRKLNEVLKK